MEHSGVDRTTPDPRLNYVVAEARGIYLHAFGGHMNDQAARRFDASQINVWFTSQNLSRSKDIE